MPMKKKRIINTIIYFLIFCVGCCFGELIDWGYFILSKEISIIDALSLFLSIGCAIYIARVLEKDVQDDRIEKDMFISIDMADGDVQVAELQKCPGVIRTEIKDSSCPVSRYTFPDGHSIYVLAEGRLVNLAAGDGHPVEIMDMSFALQAMCACRMAQAGKDMKPDLYSVPRDIDQDVALRKLTALGVEIDTLTEEQERYLHG